MGIYVALRVASTPALFLCLSAALALKWPIWRATYFYLYWSVYIASAILIFFVCFEVFRSALAAFSGLQRFGLVIFRWVALASLIVAFTTTHTWHHGILIITDIAYGLMRAVSMLELCLLAFLCLCMNALQLSVRDRAFGISLGLGLLAAGDFMVASLMTYDTSITSTLEFVYQAMVLLALSIWIAYAALPEPVRRPTVVSPNSTIYRWNEIASALGYTGTKIAVQQPASSFFLDDVEKMADKVLTRDLK